MGKETRIFEVTGSKIVIERLERFLALLHYNSGFGHSGLFAMPMDGDGNEKISVNGIDKRLGNEVDALGGVGYDVEVAMDGMYSGRFLDRKREPKWAVKPSAILYEDGDIVRTVPSCDWSHPKHKG